MDKIEDKYKPKLPPIQLHTFNVRDTIKPKFSDVVSKIMTMHSNDQFYTSNKKIESSFCSSSDDDVLVPDVNPSKDHEISIIREKTPKNYKKMYGDVNNLIISISSKRAHEHPFNEL